MTDAPAMSKQALCVNCDELIEDDDGTWFHVENMSMMCDGDGSTDLTRQADPPWVEPVSDGWREEHVSVWNAAHDGVLVVQIDTDGGAGRIRINLNDAPIWDGDPDTDEQPGRFLLNPNDPPDPRDDALAMINEVVASVSDGDQFVSDEDENFALRDALEEISRLASRVSAGR